jgi:Holliday junction resolvasome RuvABC endonuclease subunit
MSIILAIDPGTTKSGWCLYDNHTKEVIDFGVDDNQIVIEGIQESWSYDDVAIECIASYGMAVGSEVFETCIWVGRFMQALADCKGLPVHRIYRKDCKMHLCGTPRAKDANIRQAIIDKYGGIQSTKKGGPLYKVNSHIWPALAVALTHCKQ